MPLILGLETSCDETAAAVVEDGWLVRSNIIASQHALHECYGGVVPEIASRAHLERLSPVVHEAVATTGISLADIDAIAVGNRPGLIGSLLVGVSAAKALAWSLGKPLIGVDHVKAHLYASQLQPADGVAANPKSEIRAPKFPCLGLVVSGGHTSLYAVASSTQMHLLGKTIDDAVGEAYDKAAVILRMGYPGGPKLDRLAQTGDASAHDLPRSLLAKDSLNFSYSGLKTALLYKVRGQPQERGGKTHFQRDASDLTDTQRANLAAAFQAAAIDTLIIKLDRALDAMITAGQPARAVLIGGGVSANSLLRRRAVELAARRSIPLGLPAMAYCLDNAAMIAGLAYQYHTQGRHDDLTLPAIATTSC